MDVRVGLRRKLSAEELMQCGRPGFDPWVVHREKKREEEDRGDQEEKRGSQNERDRSSQ